MRLPLAVLATVTASLVLGACSGDDTTATPDASAADVTAEGSPCGPLTLVCKPGEPGKACSQVPSTPKCNGTTWECSAGSISASLCGCAADVNRPVGSDCKDGGTTVDASGDAPADTGSDASSDGGSNG